MFENITKKLKKWLKIDHEDCPIGSDGCRGSNVEHCSIKKYISKKRYFYYTNVTIDKSEYSKQRDTILELTCSIISTIIIPIILCIAFLTDIPLWIKLFTNFQQNNIQLEGTDIPLIYIIFIVTSILITYFIIKLYLYLKINKIKDDFIYENYHFTNTLISKYYESIKSGKIVESMDMCAEAIVRYCKAQLKIKKLGCAIRILTMNDDGSLTYNTVGRYGLTADRSSTSEPMRNDSGVLHFYSQRKNINAILICNNHEYVLKCPFCICKNTNHNKYIDEEKAF